MRKRQFSPGLLEGVGSPKDGQLWLQRDKGPVDWTKQDFSGAVSQRFLVWFSSVLLWSFLLQYNIHKEKNTSHKLYS